MHAFFCDGRLRVAPVVVPRVNDRLRREREELGRDRVVQRSGVTVLKVRAAASAHKKGIAREDEVRADHGDRIVCVSARFENVKRGVPQANHVAVGERAIHARRSPHPAHGPASAAIAQEPRPGHVVRMHMRIDNAHEAKTELLDELQVPLHLLAHRVHEQRLARVRLPDEVREGRRFSVEELANADVNS